MPPLTIENAGALVGGGAPKEIGMNEKTSQPPAMLEFDVAVGFYFGGKECMPGERVTLPRLFANEMQAANRGTVVKPTPVPAQAQPSKPTQTADSTTAVQSKGAASEKRK